MTQLTRLASLGALTAALAIAACNRDPAADNATAQAQFALPALPATLPLERGPAADIAPAPSASDLPDAAPLRLAQVAQPDQAYGYADAASGYDEALGDAPPDYGFDYEGSDPWAWQGYDDSLMVAEPIDDGYRSYYYRPGAAEPYFVRDPWYSYGFASGLLAVVYGADGGIVPYADYGPRLAYASRYYARGRQLWSVSRRAQRRPVIAATWLRQRPVILAARDRWSAGRAHQPAWQRYDQANRPRQVRYWQAEQVRRQADARRFDGWREQGFRTPPPPRAIPVAWAKASWARDDRRYRPAAEALRDRRDDARVGDRREARQDRPRRQDVARDPPNQAERREQAAATQAEQRDQRQAQRADRARPTPPDRPRVDRPQRQPERAERQRAAPDRAAEQAQRQEERQARRAERRPDRPRAEQPQRADRTERPRPVSAERRSREQPQPQAERPRRDQAAQAERRQTQQAERQQAQQAQQAQRQTERAGRQQAEQAQRQQAQQAQQAQRQAQQARPQQPAPRPQAQPQRQPDRPQRRAARGDGPGSS